MRKYFFLLLVLFFLGPVAQANDQIVVEKIGGKSSEVFLVRGKLKSVLHEGDTVAINDMITTGPDSAVDLRFPDLSIVRIGVGSTLTIAQENSSLTEKLLQGILRILVPEHQDKSKIRFQMLTPAASIGVRGTEFVVEHDDKTTTLHGLKGTVLFGAATEKSFSNEEKFQQVTKGFAASIRVGDKAATKPAAFSEKAYLESIDSSDGPFSTLANHVYGETLPRTPDTAAKTNAANPSLSQLSIGGASSSATQTTGSPQSSPSASPTDMFNAEALLQAVSKGDEHTILAAIKDGANLEEIRDKEGNTLLHIAASLDEIIIIQILIEQAGIPVDITNNANQTPLMVACRDAEKTDTLKLLLQNGADANAKDGKNGHSVYDYASGNGNVKNHPNIVNDFHATLKPYLKKK